MPTQLDIQTNWLDISDIYLWLNGIAEFLHSKFCLMLDACICFRPKMIIMKVNTNKVEATSIPMLELRQSFSPVRWWKLDFAFLIPRAFIDCYNLTLFILVFVWLFYQEKLKWLNFTVKTLVFRRSLRWWT